MKAVEADCAFFRPLQRLCGEMGFLHDNQEWAGRQPHLCCPLLPTSREAMKRVPRKAQEAGGIRELYNSEEIKINSDFI